jgi:outer membrane protein assembly factor BamD
MVKRLLILALLASACSSTTVKNSDNPEEIYGAALKMIEGGSYLEAGEHLSEIKTRFPQSRFAVMADLKSADMEFQQEHFTEAAAAYGVFVELYPKHNDAAYAQYQRSLSYFNDAPENIARDQSPASDAVSSSEQLLKRYPESQYAEKAKELLKRARLRLAEKEAYVARFYERRGENSAAKGRWETLLVAFPDLKDFPEAAALLAEAQEKVAKLQP